MIIYLLLDTTVEVRWNSNNIKHYVDKGYIFTKRNETFMVDVNDLLPNSSVKIKLRCEYCFNIFYKAYNHYYKLKNNQLIKDDCCVDCSKIKAKEVFMKKYDVDNPMNVPGSKEKLKNTFIERYGVDNYAKTDECKEKCKQTSIENWGTEYPSQSEIIKQRRNATNLKKYGCENVSNNDDIKEKRAKTFYKNGTTRTSSQQIEIFKQLEKNNFNVKLNYPVSSISLDVAIFIDELKIDLEYDGWKWHQNQQRDRRRDEFLKSEGWKIVRIKSGHKLPTFEQIQTSINKLVNSDRTFTQIVLDDWKIN